MMKDIPGFEGLYKISDEGHVICCTKTILIGNYKTARVLEEKVMSPFEANGYLCVFLKRWGGRAKFSVHRLVAQAFVPNPENKPVVNHKDRNRQNNHHTNLEWCTYSENTNHWYLDERNKPVTVHDLSNF